MDKVYLLSLFQSQKGFLKKLYEGDQTPRILAVANDHSLNVLIRILHLIANGEIVLSKEHASVIKKSLRLNKLRKFESQKYFIKYEKEIRNDFQIVSPWEFQINIIVDCVTQIRFMLKIHPPKKAFTL